MLWVWAHGNFFYNVYFDRVNIMDKRKLCPAREQLMWIPVFLVCISLLSTVEAYLVHRIMPEYTMKYVTYYNYKIWKLYGLYLLTLISIGWYIYIKKIPESIIKNGESFSGQICEIIWHRAFFNWCEWKVMLVIKTDGFGEIKSPYYKYDLLNYLSGTDCKVHIWKNKCYITDFHIIERDMAKEEQIYGLYGGRFLDSKNLKPDFPIMKKVKSTDKFLVKSSRGMSQRTVVCVSVAMFVIISLYNTLSMFEPVDRDSDKDGIKDYMEFKMGTDPTIYDESFTFVMTDEMDGSKLEYRVEIVAPCTYDLAIMNMHISFIRNPVTKVETIPGYIMHPFCISNEKKNTKAVIKIEFDEKLLEKPNFYPKLFRFSVDHQEEGMVPVTCDWDGKSNVVYADFDFAAKLDPLWEYYLLDGYEWQQWYDNYWK